MANISYQESLDDFDLVERHAQDFSHYILSTIFEMLN